MELWILIYITCFLSYFIVESQINACTEEGHLGAAIYAPLLQLDAMTIVVHKCHVPNSPSYKLISLKSFEVTVSFLNY